MPVPADTLPQSENGGILNPPNANGATSSNPPITVGSNPAASSSTVSFAPATSSTPSTPDKPYRHRAVSAVSTASTSASSTISTSSGVVSDKRQAEFQKHFGDDLEPLFDDSFDVLATQSTDLQSSVLIHGRLYLTRHHLCFRANILGIVTKKIHPLKDVVQVEKGTTAKWIQNAVYIYMEGEERYVGYGSLGDRDAMYDDIVAAWKLEAPERYEAAQAAERADTDAGGGVSGAVDKSETSTLNGIPASDAAVALPTTAVASTAPATAPSTATAPVPASASAPAPSKSTAATASKSTSPATAAATPPVKHTSDSGEHYKEVAIDTVFHMTMDEVFNLVYRNREFIMDFYTREQKLTDVKISEWTKGPEGEERTLTYVMTISNPVGPNQSECFGSEKIVVANPEEAYEILSETRTPGLPAGKSFVVKTRTCLTHTGLHGKQATRMYCTSQCDWSSFSMLKSTITPAVIKGQKSYYANLAKSIRHWVKTHPQDYGEEAEDAEDEEEEGDGVGEVLQSEKVGEDSIAEPVTVVSEKDGHGAHTTTATTGPRSLFDHTLDIPNNPVMLGITLLCACFLLREVYSFVM